MVELSTGIAYQEITEDNGTKWRLELGRNGSGRQDFKLENVTSGNQLLDGISPRNLVRLWLFISELVSYDKTCNWARPDTCLDETKLTRHSTRVEVVCWVRIRMWVSRPPTGSDDPYVGETNWSGPFVRVGETRPDMPLAAVEVQGTALSVARQKKLWTAGQCRGVTGFTICNLAGLVPGVKFCFN
ncbi:hypothetical protein L1987_30395 [Smallanthus sonchifolius]|uniref:Uncharacterized protein n=1 Tax=Smallanthus sonchifolius TaxID=185202 RepID=A0ACB9I4G9_9ASTR|nr:hypothetical protein L1987_30395 [Smallanthus sonchifolius]